MPSSDSLPLFPEMKRGAFPACVMPRRKDPFTGRCSVARRLLDTGFTAVRRGGSLVNTPNKFRSEGVPPHLPFGDMFFARLGLSAQADRRPKALSPDFESAGPRRLCNWLEVCQQYCFSSGRARGNLTETALDEAPGLNGSVSDGVCKNISRIANYLFNLPNKA